MTLKQRALSLILLLSIGGLFIGFLTHAAEDRESYTFETVRVEMGDGVSLATDLYLPKGEGKFPTVLIRTPYDKSHAMNESRVKLFTTQDIAVVVQDCRGRVASGGVFNAFRDEREDGLDCLKWIRNQPWFGGKIGGAQGSYNGYTQLAVADELDVVLDIVSCANMYEFVYPGGLYSLESIHNWAFNMDSKISNGLTPEAITKSYWTLPLSEATIQAYGRKGQFVDDWLKHDKYDTYWQQQDYRNISQATTFSFAGWYDIFLRGQIADFEALPPAVKSKSRLVIGPWAHGQHEIKNDFGGSTEALDFENLSLKLLATTLKGGAPGELFTTPLSDARYNLFIMEKNEYFPSDIWPPVEARATEYHLTGTGTLSIEIPANRGLLEYAYNPADPYPSKGGTVLGTPAGQADQRTNESRTDQLVFNQPISDKPLTLLGPINARLFVETDAPNTDFFVLLQDVFPDGKVVNIQEGGSQYIPGKKNIGRIEFSVWATGYQFNPGHTLRVVVTSSWFPRFNRNLNMGDSIYSAKKMRTANQRVHYGKTYPSAIILPVLNP